MDLEYKGISLTTPYQNSISGGSTRFYLNVPYDEKDQAKALGARFDWNKKRWYFIRPQDYEKFLPWIPDQQPVFTEEPEIATTSIVPLSEEQRKVIDVAATGQNILVDACIGSGKTTTIQQLCNEFPDKKILYLTYNRLLKEDARKKIKAKNVMVTNYHGFAYGVLKRLSINVSPNDAVDRFNMVKPITVKGFDLLVLDEYQDIDEAIGELLMHIKSMNPGIQIIAVGDMAQKIYDKSIINIMGFINSLLEEHENLSFSNCYRLSKAHAARLGMLWNKPIIGCNNRCIVKKLPLTQATALLAASNPEDILCLGMRNGTMTIMLNYLESHYPDKFNKNTVYASIRDEERSAPFKPGSAIFTTFDGSKGMERKICVVFDFTEEYWNSRITKPASKYEIIKNIFLVAASRGKEQIIFVKKSDEEFLSDKTISTVVGEKYSHPKPFDASSMYDFNYDEHIKECLSYVKKRRIPMKDKSEIVVQSMDGNIDISPCIGIYTEASYFNDYNIDFSIKMAEKLNPDKVLSLQDDAGLEEKILGLVAYETGQNRYFNQVKPPFLNDAQKSRIHERLATKLGNDETVQEECSVIFTDHEGTQYEICGICDVVKNEHVYELKFTTALSDAHFLQTAFYLCAMGYKSGYLWNIRTNDIFQITVPDRKTFLQATVNSITKGNIKKSKSFQRSKRQDET